MLALLQAGVRMATSLSVIHSASARQMGLGAGNQHTVKVLEDEFHYLLF